MFPGGEEFLVYVLHQVANRHGVCGGKSEVGCGSGEVSGNGERQLCRGLGAGSEGVLSSGSLPS
jgi:hypothetical protein